MINYQTSSDVTKSPSVVKKCCIMVTKHVYHSKIVAMKEALGDHLYAKVQLLQPAYAERITAMLLECDNKEILHLLTNADLLNDRVNQAMQAILCCQQASSEIPLSKDKQELGEFIFVKVAELESELCAQITGMLLELDSVFLHRLLNSPCDLNFAVQKAKLEFLKELQLKSNEHCTREIVGEKIHCVVHQKYPECADKITGMLLEMDLGQLQALLHNLDHLTQKIELAMQVLKRDAS